MFWNSKEKKAKKAKEFWIGMAHMFMIEHDRTYDGTLSGAGKALEDGDAYYQGKYLYRKIAYQLAIGSAFVAGEMRASETQWQELHQAVTVLAVAGTEACISMQPSMSFLAADGRVEPIDVDLLTGIGGAEWDDVLGAACIGFMSGRMDDALSALVGCYVTCFKPVLGDAASEELLSTRAENIFLSCKASMTQYF